MWDDLNIEMLGVIVGAGNQGIYQAESSISTAVYSFIATLSKNTITNKTMHLQSVPIV